MAKWYWQDVEKAPPLKPLIAAMWDGTLRAIKSKKMDEPYEFHEIDGNNKMLERVFHSEDIRVWNYLRHIPQNKDLTPWAKKIVERRAERKRLEEEAKKLAAEAKALKGK